MKIYINKSLFESAKIHVVLEEGRDRYAVTYDSKEKLLNSTLIPPNCATRVEPFLELPSDFFDDLVKAILDYASENNIKTENENLLQGKLAATEKHLEDMRIAFNKLIEKA